MARKRVMESAADVESDARFHGQPRRQYGAARGQPERLHHLARVGNLQAQDVLVSQRAVPQLVTHSASCTSCTSSSVAGEGSTKSSGVGEARQRISRSCSQRYFFEGKTWSPRCRSYVRG